VAANLAQFRDEACLPHYRQEGEFIVSYRTPGGWVAITKDLLTDFLAAGQDVGIAETPARPPRCCD
jgi:hypothetical protein